MASWTDSKEIKRILLQKWEKGYILKNAFCKDNFFPFSQRLKYPDQKEANQRLSDVIEWRKKLICNSKSECGFGYEVIEKEFHYAVLGKNSLPTHIRVDTLQDAIKLIGKQKELELFHQNSQLLIARHDVLREWIAKNPFKVVAIGSDCEVILKVIEWFVSHKERALYLRQLDIDGVDTKFTENNQVVLNELLMEILEPNAYKAEENRFELRYGLMTKPDLVRFRILDQSYVSLGITDISLSLSELKQIELPFKRIFIVENEINFLCFPQVADSCIFFGRGYGVDFLGALPSLKEKEAFYWGDIDTHGFNILSRARSFLPQIQSFFMTEEILLEYRNYWVNEKKQFLAPINHLTQEEYALACKLQTNQWGSGVRLEQERIRFSYVMRFVTSL